MSNIEWTDETWNPVTGCDKVSQGCKNCYAEKMHKRLGGMGQEKYSKPFLGNVLTHEDELMKPYQWKKGKRIFVNSMSDLFHKDVPFEFIVQVYTIMVNTPRHTYQVLTKRSDRLLEFYNWYKSMLPAEYVSQYTSAKNIWVGVSCEDQKTVDERVPYLLQVPAAIRFLSCEPLLERIDITAFGSNLPLDGKIIEWRKPGKYYEGPKIHWVIAGGESGSKARPMHPDWIRFLRQQCEESNTPFFFKQWGEWIDNQNMPRQYIAENNLKRHVFESGYFSTEVWKLGKSKTGNTIDGKQYLQFPTV
jgi:protein gp37